MLQCSYLRSASKQKRYKREARNPHPERLKNPGEAGTRDFERRDEMTEYQKFDILRIVIDAYAGQDISDVVHDAMILSMKHRSPVEFDFNGRLVTVDASVLLAPVFKAFRDFKGV